MHEPFDPYHKWLSISPKDQPPNHYRLLGLDLFEPDADVISGAADQRMAHVRTFQAGPRSAQSQKILNEISAARVCLLNPEIRKQYDGQLRAELAATESERTGSATGAVNREPPILSPPPQPRAGQPSDSPPPSLGKAQPVATTPAPPAVPPPRQTGEAPVAILSDSPATRRRRPNRQRWEAVAAIALAVAICIGSIAALRSSDDSQEVASQENGNPNPSGQAPPAPPEPAPAREPGTSGADDKKPTEIKEEEKTKETEKAAETKEMSKAAATREATEATEAKEPEEAKEPKGTGSPSVETSDASGTLGKARDAIASRELATARDLIQEAKDIPEAARVRMLLEANENFWGAVRAATGNLKVGNELKLGGMPVGSVVEVADNELIIHRQGANSFYVIDEDKPPKKLPWKVAVALAERVQLLKGNTPTDLAIGAFLAVDHQGDRDEARRRLKLSGKKGEELMPELELAGAVRSYQRTRGPLGELMGRDADENDDGLVDDGLVKEADVPEEEVEKLPIPDSPSLAKAEEKLKDDLASVKSIRDRQDRVDRLLAAAKANPNPAEQFILYRYAVDATVDVANPHGICGAIERMDRYYVIDALGMKADGLQKAYRSKHGVPYRDALVKECEGLLSTAMAAKNYQAAGKAVRVAISGARAKKDFRRLGELEDEKKRIESLLPDRPQSN